MSIVIEKGIPMPNRNYGNKKYLFSDMLVGDSFAIPLAGTKGSSTSHYAKWDAATRKLNNAAQAYCKRYGGKFAVREFKSENVARIWRIS